VFALWRDQIPQINAHESARAELKGNLRPAEVTVDKQALVDVARMQNKALILIHEQLESLHVKLEKVEVCFTNRLDELEKKAQVSYIILMLRFCVRTKRRYDNHPSVSYRHLQNRI